MKRYLTILLTLLTPTLIAVYQFPGMPNKAIIPINGACPSGWTEYATARGRVVVGLPASGTTEGTKGTALADLATVSYTPTGTVSAPSFTGSSVNTNSTPSTTGSATTGISASSSSYDPPNENFWKNLSPSVSVVPHTPAHTHAMTVNGDSGHSHSMSNALHTFTALGSNAAPTFTGTPTTAVTIPYIQLRLCKRS